MEFLKKNLIFDYAEGGMRVRGGKRSKTGQETSHKSVQN